MSYEFVAKHAEYVVARVLEPLHTREQYEDAMLDMAKAEARPGETKEGALVRMVQEGDPRMAALSRACQHLEMAKMQAAADQRRADVESGRAGEQVRKVCENREQAWDRMREMAKRGRRDSETDEQALDRMLLEDPTMQAAYRDYTA